MSKPLNSAVKALGNSDYLLSFRYPISILPEGAKSDPTGRYDGVGLGYLFPRALSPSSGIVSYDNQGSGIYWSKTVSVMPIRTGHLGIRVLGV